MAQPLTLPPLTPCAPPPPLSLPLSLSLALSHVLECWSRMRSSGFCQCAPRHRSTPPHCTDCCCAWSTRGRKRSEEEVRSRDIRKRRKARRGRRRGRTGGRSAPWPQRRPHRRASPMSAGKSQVSANTSCFRGSMCNLCLSREKRSMAGFRTRVVSLSLPGCPLSLLFPARSISKELSTTGNVSQGKSRVNGCWSLWRL